MMMNEQDITLLQVGLDDEIRGELQNVRVVFHRKRTIDESKKKRG
jgi:hypothetical protein